MPKVRLVCRVSWPWFTFITTFAWLTAPCGKQGRGDARSNEPRFTGFKPILLVQQPERSFPAPIVNQFAGAYNAEFHRETAEGHGGNLFFSVNLSPCVLLCELTLASNWLAACLA